MLGASIAIVLGASVALAAAPDPGSEQQRADGKQLYDKYCSQCHGINGDGQGHATSRVKPEPRDFTSGKYKFRTTASGMLPTDDDLRRVIEKGLPYTSMPGWPRFNATQVQNIIYYLKTFSDDFQSAEKLGEPIPIPPAPPATEESIERGRQVYEAQGCAACHGQLGRGDGASAPLLSDDWGNHIKAVDISMPWTFRGGPTPEDMFRTFTTGVNGTPMPSYEEVLAVEDRWDLVSYMVSLGEGQTPNYADMAVVTPVDDEINLDQAETLFENAPTERFPLLGQIVQPGRNFFPPTSSIQFQGVYNRTEIAFRIRWHDMRAETVGDNSPRLESPLWDDTLGGAGADEDEGDDFWGEEESEGDFWGEEESGDDFWGEEDEGRSVGEQFTDAFALQFPSVLPAGIRKPYFLMGDAQNPAHLWFVDMADKLARQYVARGSDSIEPFAGEEIDVRASFDRGEWTLLMKRARSTQGSVSFNEGQFVPLAFSVWDGFSQDRGNRRAASRWLYVYLEPLELPSPVGPMVKTALIVLLIELGIVFYIRRSRAGATAPSGRVATARG